MHYLYHDPWKKLLAMYVQVNMDYATIVWPLFIIFPLLELSPKLGKSFHLSLSSIFRNHLGLLQSYD
ncbi:hypothetical protein PIB30_056303 [Stylosanthes scabra]|uniref:Uncharacterized protein n=1 Tax=Stylosanthes scabra TaxID=79078 RepID=A0ABU6ZI14_9FABA|nr:hypothetical protein [Stylosanthes scabra]